MKQKSTHSVLPISPLTGQSRLVYNKANIGELSFLISSSLTKPANRNSNCVRYTYAQSFTNMNELHNRLFSLPGWGYVIYRTTYSAGSDALFPDAIRFIEACIKTGVLNDGAERPHNYASED